MKSIVIGKMSTRVFAMNLATSWNTVSAAAVDVGRRLLPAIAFQFDGVTTIGVDEHCWSHRGIDRWVTVIADLTHCPDRRLDIVPGRSGEAFSGWRRSQPQGFQRGIDYVAVDVVARYSKAATAVLPVARTVMDALPRRRPPGHEVR